MPDKKYQLTSLRKEKTTTVSEDQRSSGVTGNIRAAVLSCDHRAYDRFNSLVQRSNTTADGDLIPLHHSYGANHSKKDRVISFNVAGSSFAQPLRYEKGLAGKSNIWLFDETSNEKVHIKKGKAGHVYTFTHPDGSTTELNGKDAVRKYTEMRTDEVFGKSGVLGKDDIREKISPDGHKVKYSLSGPRFSFLGIKDDVGIMNVGDYHISNTREYICTLGDKQLKELSENSEFMDSGEHIHFTFTGHSRGGVGVIEGAMQLKGLIRKKYPQLAERIHFQALLYDPVPGPKVQSKSNINHSINLKEQSKEMKALDMLPFDEKDHCTVMYSMGCNNETGFTPMKVMGADTIILTGHSHDEGLKDLEIQDGQTKRMAYINADNCEAYRASGLCEMPNGVFISDENNIMTRAKDMDTVESVINQVYTRDDKLKNDRIRRITEACTDIQVRSGNTPTIDTIVRGFNAHDPFYVKSSPEFKDMRAKFEALQKLRNEDQIDEIAFQKASMQLKESALEYIASKDGSGPHSNRTQGRLTVAKNIIRFLDHSRETGLNWYGLHELDQTEKTNDIREAYIANTTASLSQNMSYMEGICKRYEAHKPVETDMFLQTLTSMMADRYFLTHSKSFMPNPLTNTTEHPTQLRALDALFSNGNTSLYGVFSKSPSVNHFVKDLLDRGDTLKLFSDPEQTKKCLDALCHSVEKEAAQQMTHRSPANTEKTIKREPIQREAMLH